MELHIFNDKNRQIAVLLDDDMKIVKPVYAFLRFQQQRGRTLNTLKAEGNNLRTYWRYLETVGLTYSEATPATILDFIDYLRREDNL